MPGKSNFLETLLLRHVFIGATASPSSGWVALHNGTIVDAASGTEISTVGTNYGRMQYAPGSANWTSLGAPSSVVASTMSNKAAINFSSATASYTVQAVGYWNSSAAGELLYMSSVVPKVVEVGDIATISSADFKISEE
jgi:hypothetical protein